MHVLIDSIDPGFTTVYTADGAVVPMLGRIPKAACTALLDDGSTVDISFVIDHEERALLGVLLDKIAARVREKFGQL